MTGLEPFPKLFSTESDLVLPLSSYSIFWFPAAAYVFFLSFLFSCPFYATNRQVAGSIPDGVIEIFQWHNPSGRTMALGSTQPLTEMSTRCISWG